jgi:polyhydroxyalkanoate synthesis regulator phasin
MAIGFNLPGIPGQIRGTAEEAGAAPDLGQAMMQGFRSNVENIQGYPRQLAQQLVANQLANTINRAKAKYAEPMAKTQYDQTLANLQHQGLINKFYPDLMRSQLSGAGLTQEHQRMLNEKARMQLELYKDSYNAFKNMGASHEQAHNAALQQAQQGAKREELNPEFAAMLTGKNMPEYLSNIAPEQQAPQSYAESLRMAPELPQGYTPAQQNLFEPGYTQTPLEMELTGQQPMSMELTPSRQTAEAPEYLQRPTEMELTEGLPARMPAQAQAQPQAQSYAEQLQQAGFNTDNIRPEYAQADQLYINSPLHRKMLEEMAPGAGIKTYNDFPRNRQITTMTLPSGATKTTTRSLGGAEGAEKAAYKSQGPYSKAYEDFQHYMNIGDLQGAEGAKKYVDNLLNRDKKSQTEYDKSYKEWENAVEEFGPDSQKAKDYRARIEALNRGSLIRNEPRPPTGSTMVYDENNNLVGYEKPLSKEQIESRVSPVGFNILYPYVSEGVKPYQGTISEVNSAIENDLKNQDVDQGAADRLYRFMLAKNLLTSASAREIKMLDAPKVKNVWSGLKDALGGTDFPLETFFEKAKNYKVYEKRINQAIKNQAQDDFGKISKIVASKIQEARDTAEREREFVPSRKTINLGQQIKQGADVVKKQQKSKPIKMMPNANGILEVVDNG